MLVIFVLGGIRRQGKTNGDDAFEGSVEFVDVLKDLLKTLLLV